MDYTKKWNFRQCNEDAICMLDDAMFVCIYHLSEIIVEWISLEQAQPNESEAILPSSQVQEEPLEDKFRSCLLKVDSSKCNEEDEENVDPNQSDIQ